MNNPGIYLLLSGFKCLRQIGQFQTVRLLFLLSLFISINSDLSYCQNSGCGINWLSSIQISLDSVLSVSPRFSLSGNKVHALWFGLDTLGTMGNDGIQYARSIDSGKTFEPQRTLISPDTAFSPGCIASAGNLVYVTFTGFIGNSFGTILIRSWDNGQTWQPARMLLENAQPRFIVAADAVVLIHYVNQRSGKGILRSDDYGQLWNNVNSNIPMLNDIVISSNDFHAVGPVESSQRTEVGYYYSLTGGVSWTGPEIISREDPISSLYPKISVNENGTRFCVWNEKGNIVMRQSDGYDADDNLLWQPQRIAYDGGDAVFPGIAATNSFAMITWDIHRSDSSAVHLRQSSIDVPAFCPDDLLIDSRAGEPYIKTQGDLLHMMWSAETSTGGEVFYRQGALTPDLKPRTYALKQNYPNPVNGTTRIEYDILRAGPISLSVYNLLGQKVATISDEYAQQERYVKIFDTSTSGGLPSGVYFYQLKTRYFVETKKMLILR